MRFIGRTHWLAVGTMIGTLAVSAPASADVVQYMGSLMIGFGDSDNASDVANNAVPICAHTGPNPFAPQTFGSLRIYGRAEQTAAGALTFSGHGKGNGPQAGSLDGGSEIKLPSTCTVFVPPFLNPRLRSRTQVGSARWPSLLGAFSGSGTTPTPAPTPATTPTYMIGAGGGHSFAGTQLVTTIPFIAGGGFVSITKGPNNFGGAIPFQGGGGFQVGIQTASSHGPPATTFGISEYVNGYLPMGPQFFGTDATGIFNNAPTVGSVTSFPNGLWAGQRGTMALRTPGGTTIDQQGAIRTLFSGNTVTQSCPPPTPCAGAHLTSPVQHDGAYFQWTTGMVRHMDLSGDFVTERTATGFDIAIATPTLMPHSTTRKLQLVSPWSASIKLVGPFGFPVPNLGYGGLAVLTLDIAPIPEAGALAMLGAGLVGLVGLSEARGQRRRRYRSLMPSV